MLFFDESGTWEDGVVVMHDPSQEDQPGYVIFYEVDDVWECVDVPDDTVVFRKPTGSHRGILEGDPRVKGNAWHAPRRRGP